MAVILRTTSPNAFSWIKMVFYCLMPLNSKVNVRNELPNYLACVSLFLPEIWELPYRNINTYYNDVIMRTGTGEFPAQRASYAESVSIWWRHHVFIACHFNTRQSIFHACGIGKMKPIRFVDSDNYINFRLPRHQWIFLIQVIVIQTIWTHAVYPTRCCETQGVYHISFLIIMIDVSGAFVCNVHSSARFSTGIPTNCLYLALGIYLVIKNAWFFKGTCQHEIPGNTIL